MRQYEPLKLFAFSEAIALHLRGGHVEGPKEAVAQWLGSVLGAFAKRVEPYSIKEFIDRYSKFLRETLLENILLVEIDYNPVYQDRRNKSSRDLDEALKATKQYFARHGGESNKVLISALGKTRFQPKSRNLHLTVEGQYYRKHGFGKPAIEVKVRGIPSLLLPHEKETVFDFKERQAGLAQRLSDSRKLAAFQSGCERTMGLVTRDYEVHLNRFFDVDSDYKS